MKENVKKFFQLYEQDESLRERVAMAKAMYPGSYELREAMTEAILLPIAKDMGLEFDLKALRAYETGKKLRRSELEYDPDNDDFEGFWLLDRGWNSEESKFCGD